MHPKRCISKNNNGVQQNKKYFYFNAVFDFRQTSYPETNDKDTAFSQPASYAQDPLNDAFGDEAQPTKGQHNEQNKRALLHKSSRIRLQHALM